MMHALFKLLCHTGDIGSDLGKARFDQIHWMEKDQGVIVDIVGGKTTRGTKENTGIVLKSDDMELCPVKALQEYLQALKSLVGHITKGYVFRVQNRKGDGIKSSFGIHNDSKATETPACTVTVRGRNNP